MPSKQLKDWHLRSVKRCAGGPVTIGGLVLNACAALKFLHEPMHVRLTYKVLLHRQMRPEQDHDPMCS